MNSRARLQRCLRLLGLLLLLLPAGCSALQGRSAPTPEPGPPTTVIAVTAEPTAPVAPVAATEASPVSTAPRPELTSTLIPPASPAAGAEVTATSAAPAATPAETQAPPAPIPPPTDTPAPAGMSWRTITLLTGPGAPGRLYVFQYGAAIAEASAFAQHVRFLISDDYGKTWVPFPGGLPVEDSCVVNVNLDYAAPDALYASTCRGLYRWSGAEWTLLSDQQTAMVAVDYGRPEVIWATQSIAAASTLPPVIRSDDGGRTWNPAADGLEHFYGVANLAIDPRNSDRLYAIVWPKYAGYHLRRGNANGTWGTVETPSLPSSIDTGMALDGASGSLYVVSGPLLAQIWRSPNPDATDMQDIRWEPVHDFNGEMQVELLAAGWSPQGLALYADLFPLTPDGYGGAWVGDPVLHRSPDGGQTWEPIEIEQP